MDFPDVYGWICSVLLTSEADETHLPFLQLCISSVNTNSLIIGADTIHNASMFFSLSPWLPSLNIDTDLPVLSLGSCTVGDCEESMQKRTFQMLFNVISFLYLRIPCSVIIPTLKTAIETMKFRIDPDTIEASSYKEVFNSALLLLCSTIRTRSTEFEFTEEALERAAKQCTPPQLGVDVVECLMRSLGYRYTKWWTLDYEFMLNENILLSFGYKYTKWRTLDYDFMLNENIMHSLGYKNTKRWTMDYDFMLNEKISNGPSRRSTYNLSFPGFLIISVYCPLLSMRHLKFESYKLPQIRDKRLQFALCYQQLESILQFRYAVTICQDWIELRIAIDNARCDAVPLECDEAMHKQGAPNERHFPSKISLAIGPQQPSDVLQISLTRSSDNPGREITNASSIEAKFEPPISLGLKASGSVTSTIKISHWSFEQSSRGMDGTLKWTLYDTVNGKEVSSSKPPKSSVLDPKTWFKDRYSKAYRPFTKQGGVVFASDNYGQPLTWRLHRSMEGKTLEWHVRGTIWLTYWPNTYNTYYSETRYHEFCQMVEIPLLERS